MSSSESPGFGAFLPGFDFLQNLAKSSGAGQMPGLGAWVAPTLDPQEIEKRINELKTVVFWLEQNTRALTATIQALEVQKMTLATLKDMNFSMGSPKPQTSPPSADPSRPATDATDTKNASDGAAAGSTPSKGVVDPLQLWGALTQQFQEIASNAVKDVSSSVAANMTKAAAAQAAKAPAASRAQTQTKKPAAKRAAAKKAASR